jgi:NitT/TauT family transport system permease protein
MRPAVSLNIARTSIIATIIFIWELATRIGYLDPLYVSTPVKVGKRLWEWISSGEIVSHLLTTLHELGLGLLIGILVGVFMALLVGSNATLTEVFRPIITVAYSFPQLALAPLYILWFGVYLLPKVILISIVVFFLMFFNTFEGIKTVERELIDAMRVLGARRRDLFRMVVLPATAVYVVTGLRHAVPFALRAAVFAEFISSVRGLGFLAMVSGRAYDSAGVYAALICLLAVGVVLNAGVGALERAILPWHRQEIGSRFKGIGNV